MPEQELQTATEVARRLGIHKTTLLRHLKDGPPEGPRSGDLRQLKTVRIGKTIRFLKASVDAFIYGE